MDSHLAACAACRAWAAGLVALPSRLAAWQAPELTPEFEAKVLASLPRARRMPLWARMAAELLIFVLGTLAGLGAVRLFGGRNEPAALPVDPAALGGGVDLADMVTGD